MPVFDSYRRYGVFDHLIKDNFFASPDGIREFALTHDDWRTSVDHVRGGNWPGHRSGLINTLSGEIFSQLMLGLRRSLGLTSFDLTYIVSYFQYCTKTDGESWIHQDDTDIYSHVGIVYLTPNPPSDSGTVIYHPPENSASPDSEYQKTAKVKKVIDNRYNRLTIYNPKDFHKSDQYFGNDIHDSRLFIVFFMKVRKTNSSLHAINHDNVRNGVPYFGRPHGNQICVCGSGRYFSQCCASDAANSNIPKGIHVIKNAVQLAERKAIIQAIKLASKKGRGIDYSSDMKVQASITKLVSRLCCEEIPNACRFLISAYDHPKIFIRKKGRSIGNLDVAEIYNDNLGHVERHSVIDYHILIALNKNYTGGEIWFGYYDVKLEVERDDIVIIPAHDQYSYDLMEVKDRSQFLLGVNVVKKVPGVNYSQRNNLSLITAQYDESQLSS